MSVETGSPYQQSVGRLLNHSPCHTMPSAKTVAKPRSWALNTLAQTVGRTLFATLFACSIVFNLLHLDDAANRMIEHGFEHGHSAAKILIVCAMTLSCLGTISLLLNQARSTYLLLAFLIPVTVQEHLVPVIHLLSKNQTIDPATYGQLVSLLKNIALIGALIVIGCQQRRLIWSENERKAEIQVALESFFAQQAKDTKKAK